MPWTTTKVPGDIVLSADWNAMTIDQLTRIKNNGTIPLTANWDIGDTFALLTDQIKARDAAGLKLTDDANFGLFVQDGSGWLGINTLTPFRPVDIVDTTTSQLRLSYTVNTVYVDFACLSTGELYIDPIGGNTRIPGVLTLSNTGLHILDTNSSHDMIIACGDDITADRTLIIYPGDASRALTLSGSPTLGDWFDQAVKAASSPTFNYLTLSARLLLTPLGAEPGTPVEGQFYANSTTHKAYFYNGASWLSIVEIGGGGAADLIIEGDSSVEIADDGTPAYGEIIHTVDAVVVASMLASGLTHGNAGVDVLLTAWNDSNPALRVAYDGTYYTNFQALATGTLCILPSGESIYLFNTSVNNNGSVILDNAVTVATGNWRGFRDESAFIGEDNNGAYACFDAEATTNSGAGNYNYDHIVGFQSRPNHNSLGSLNQLAGFSSVIQNNGGTVNEAWGFKAYDTTGTGIVTTQYGLLINDLTKATTNYGIYSAGTAVKHYIGGTFGIGTTTQTALCTIYGAYAENRGQLCVWGTTSSHSYMSFWYSVSAVGFVGWIGGNMELDNYNNNTGGNIIIRSKAANGESARFDINGNFGIGTTGPDAKLDVLSITEQLRLTYTDGTIYTGFTTDSNGYLTIAPTGSQIIIPTSGYLWFGAAVNHGLRDNAGVMEYKDTTGAWTPFAGAAGFWTQTGSDIWYIAGNVGIGTNTADKTLEVLSTTGQLRLTHTDAAKFCDFAVDTNHDITIKPSSTGQVIFQSTTDSVDFFQIRDADVGTPVFNVDVANERVGVKNAAPAYDLDVTGTIYCTNIVIVDGTELDGRWRRCGPGGISTWATLPAGGAPTYTLGTLTYSATPDVSSCTSWTTQTTAVTITNMLGCSAGDIRSIRFADTDTTIAHGTYIKLSGGLNFIGGVNDTLVLRYEGTSPTGIWYELSRSINS